MPDVDDEAAVFCNERLLSIPLPASSKDAFDIDAEDAAVAVPFVLSAADVDTGVYWRAVLDTEEDVEPIIFRATPDCCRASLVSVVGGE